MGARARASAAAKTFSRAGARAAGSAEVARALSKDSTARSKADNSGQEATGARLQALHRTSRAMRGYKRFDRCIKGSGLDDNMLSICALDAKGNSIVDAMACELVPRQNHIN
jgi:hypothetical protein